MQDMLIMSNTIAFADPIKRMVLEMFPWADRECLYGPSKLRNNIIPGTSSKNKKSLTYRQVLIDLGKQGRDYDEDHWVNIFDYTVKNYTVKPYKHIICNDVRYRNEFDYLKANNYFLIRVLRNVDRINDSSETNQDEINNEEFDAIIDNNGTLQELEERVNQIVSQIRKGYTNSLASP